MEDYFDVEIKTIGELFDQLCIENNKIFYLVEQTKGIKDVYVQDKIQTHNRIRHELVRAINRRLGERDIGGKV
jgi:hypothetical protein